MGDRLDVKSLSNSDLVELYRRVSTELLDRFLVADIHLDTDSPARYSFDDPPPEPSNTGLLQPFRCAYIVSGVSPVVPAKFLHTH